MLDEIAGGNIAIYIPQPQDHALPVQHRQG